ncbi:MAG: hypothetical protein II839_01030 [Kiritimatiellae bacterium]|nr:hypothetical protein [Kiritimatiellia bacterium]
MKTPALPVLLAAALLAGCASNPEADRYAANAARVRETAAARVAALPASDGAFAFASPFSDHMVLQRGMPVPVWGTGKPGAEILVRLFDGPDYPCVVVAEATATVGPNGRWIVFLPPQSAGDRPFALEAADLARRGEGADGAILAVKDVLFGDVWLCGGQSNMEMSFTWGVKDGEKELADADLPQVRLLHVQRAIDIDPRDSVAGTWTPCNAETARGFSACGFFFGRALQREIGVPVGLVEDCWSGTVAETWLSMERAAAVPNLEKAVAERRRVIDDWKKDGPEKFQAKHDAWKKKLDPVGEAAAAPDFTEGEGWADAPMPFSFEQAISGGYDGVVWLRAAFEATAEQAAAADATVFLGAIDDEDDAWLNGTKIGHTAGWQELRRYKIPAGLLREGTNTLAVRVLDSGGNGGFHGADTDVPRFEFGGAAPALSLAGGDWRRLAGPSLRDNPEPKDPTKPGGFPNVPAACFNGMVAPLFPMGVRGAIWYQGCSNVGRAEQYKSLLPAVIGEWRDGFSGAVDAFPFYIVQLAAYRGTHEQPVDSGWAAMRWAQTQIGQTVPNSGTAVTIDVGDHGDIHPKNKRAVGERLAALALAQTYGRKDQALSPVPADDVALASGKSAQVRVRFADPVSGRPAALRPGAVKGFQVSKDGKTFEWAEATAEGDTVTIGSDGDPATGPASVRYAWDDYPDCDLVSADGMPVGPFELSVGPAR